MKTVRAYLTPLLLLVLAVLLSLAVGSVFLPPEFEANEVSGSWQHSATAVVLTVWLVLGLVLCVRTFQWQRRDAG